MYFPVSDKTSFGEVMYKSMTYPHENVVQFSVFIDCNATEGVDHPPYKIDGLCPVSYRELKALLSMRY